MTEREQTPRERACLDLTAAVVAAGDRYAARGRKAIANDFYNLLRYVAAVRKAERDEAAAPQGTPPNVHRISAVAAND